MEIDKLKIEIFDLISNQEYLKIQYAQLEKQKQEKLRQLRDIQNTKEQ